MKTLSRVGEARVERTAEPGTTVDTTFVLFFLAVEFGQTFSSFGLDTLLMMLTLASFAVLPYFLLNEARGFGSWVAGRAAIAAVAMLLGFAFKLSLGGVLPEMFRFLPMTLLIITAALSFYFQFYGFLRLRTVR